MGDAVLRPATTADLPALRALGEAVVPPTYGPIDAAYGHYLLDTWWTEDAMATSLASIPNIVAELDGEVVGVANLGPFGERSVMFRLYVHPHHQGIGIGSALLEAVLELNGHEPLWLEHIDGNDHAAAFYARHGFVEVGPQPNPPYRDQIWMRRDP
jgi:GNAT superfamily N-acetyltransferase